jgi:tRNA(fMet)-specific endonuclease VapC
MYIFDTDHFSLLERKDNPEGQRLYFRFSSLKPEERVTTIITFEEQVRGWTTYLAKARSVKDQVAIYRKLKKSLEHYCKIQVPDFDERAAAEFERLQKQRIRIGTMDLKIAAIALAHDAVLLSRNLRDFSRVPELKVEDWSV